MKSLSECDWVPLLVPEMPSPQELLPLLERMHAKKHYSNFGPLVHEFEIAIARKFELQSNNVTTVANATLGLELVLQALELPAGSRILLPSLTFVATATAVVRAGYQPVLCDVNAGSWMLTPDIALKVCERVRVDAVMPVATFGMPQDMQAWQQFEIDTGLPVVIDAAAGYGSQWLQEGVSGTLVFSMHATKSLPAGEGGVVVSTRPDLVAKVRQLSNFGINLDPLSDVPVGMLSCLGSNAKMSEYHAAVGLASLEKWDVVASRRRALFKQLRQGIAAASKQKVIFQELSRSGGIMAPTLFCVQMPDVFTRNKLEEYCRMACITTRRWYQPLMQNMRGLDKHCLTMSTPNAYELEKKLIGLPFFPSMTQEQCGRILEVVDHVFS